MERANNKFAVLLICLVLVLATIIAYEPVRHNDFVNFDDPRYVTQNPHIRDGITIESVMWAFGTSYANNWHPITWLSHMLDYQLFCLTPLWHHMMSLLFHIVNTLLLFWVLKRMTGAVWRSWLVAAFFALHPLHTESVAWVAERKDVLSAFFWLLTMWVYIRYTECPNFTRYVPIVVFLVFGLMSKPMLVTLPFVLLLLDYWPLGRFQWWYKSKTGALSQSKSVSSGGHRPSSIWCLVVEKIPLFILVAGSGVVTFIVQQGTGAMRMWEGYPLNIRISNAVVSYLGYIIKMIYPTSLAPLYPHLGHSLPIWQPIVSFVALVGVSAVIIYIARRRRYLAVGWLWYLGTLVPVIGLIQVGVQAMADRYTYLPSIGVFIMVAWGAAELTTKWPYRKTGLGIMSVVVLAVLLMCTRTQVRYWKNSITLFEHTIEVTENNYAMHNNYGGTLCKSGQFEEAITHFKECLRINPNHPNAHYNLGLVLIQKGETETAITHLRTSLQLKPDCPYTLINLAWILATSKDPQLRDADEAVRLAERACELTDYTDPEMLNILKAARRSAVLQKQSK